MTDLPVAILSVTSVLLCIRLLREWTKVDLCLLAIALGLPLSAKPSGLISFGFVAAFGLGALLWQSRRNRRLALRRSVAFLTMLGCAVAILWGTYRFRY